MGWCFFFCCARIDTESWHVKLAGIHEFVKDTCARVDQSDYHELRAGITKIFYYTSRLNFRYLFEAAILIILVILCNYIFYANYRIFGKNLKFKTILNYKLYGKVMSMFCFPWLSSFDAVVPDGEQLPLACFKLYQQIYRVFYWNNLNYFWNMTFITLKEKIV